MTVAIHVVVLGLVRQGAVRASSGLIGRRYPKTGFPMVIGAATLLATCLHGIESGIWEVAYWLFGALPDFRSSVLYSLNAITSYGHADISLGDHWRLMGAMEALNGWLLFGLTTAFLFAVIENFRVSDSQEGTGSLG